MDQHYYKLIEDYTKKRITSEDLADLMLWVDFNNENQQKFIEILTSYEAADKVLLAPKNKQKSWNKIIDHVQQGKIQEVITSKKIPFPIWWPVAASLFIIITAVLGYRKLHSTSQKTEISYHEIYNPKGQKRLVTMPDGSNIYLNGDSRIKYAKNFNSGKRIVFLEGEAFFDVQHLVNQPFIVHGKKVTTSVLGTSFNINAYKSSGKVLVTVQTGKVGVVFKQGKNKQVKYLLPDEQLSVSDDAFNTIKKVNADDIDSWRAYKMIFYDQPLGEITQVIEREYDVNIAFKEKKLKKIKITAKFNKCSITQIMEMIAQLSNAKYKINDNKVTIY